MKIDKLEEYKAISVTGPGTDIYDSQELQIEKLTAKVNEIIEWMNSKKDQLL